MESPLVLLLDLDGTIIGNIDDVLEDGKAGLYTLAL